MITKYEEFRAQCQASEERREMFELERAYLAGWLSTAHRGKEPVPLDDVMLDAADYAEAVLYGSIKRSGSDPLSTPSKDENDC
jgi:hypothetical protein